MTAETTICPRRSDGGPHLPRFPVSFLNQMRGFEYECAYCGIGVDRTGLAITPERHRGD